MVQAHSVSGLRRVEATRYVTPLREGGSLPALVEASDGGLYVLKFRGAGQGPKALIAELLAGEVGRALGLPVPEIVLIDLDPVLGRAEQDPEVKDLVEASAGLNLGLDYLPGSLMADPITTRTLDAGLCARVVWFDAFVTNVDRTARNPNMLLWHGEPWLIDHGASLYFHHDWSNANPDTPFAAIRKHLLLGSAASVAAVAKDMAARLDRDTFSDLVARVPEEWLDQEIPAKETRVRYVEYLTRRLEAADTFVQEAERARQELV